MILSAFENRLRASLV